MTPTLMEFVHRHMAYYPIWVALCTAAIILAMAVDLISGVRKARELGVARTSAGFKKTCEKARKYFSPYAVLLCIDAVTSYVSPVPAFSILWAAWCIFCEFRSVREKAWEKAEMRKAENSVRVLLENKEDVATLLREVLFGTDEELVVRKKTCGGGGRKKHPPTQKGGEPKA